MYALLDDGESAMGIGMAIKCFKENLRLLGDAHRQPEKFNLYNGLIYRSQAIQSLESEVHRLRSKVEDLRRCH